MQITAPANRVARLQRWELNGEVVGKLLHAAFAPKQPLMAVTAAGALPYYADLPALDMLGLNDRYLPKFVKKYADLKEAAADGIKKYAQDVQTKKFPGREHCYK